MEVRLGVLADYASISERNKLNILGIFTNIMVTNAPAVHTQMKLVAQFEFDSSEAGKKNIKIVLVDEDGKDIFSINGEVHIERSSDGSPSLMNQILNLNNMVFPRFGNYEFRILFDGITACKVPLRVIKADAPPTSN